MTHNNPDTPNSSKKERVKVTHKNIPLGGEYERCGPLPSVGHDMFRRGGGLGLGTYRLLRHLDFDETCTAKELAEQTGLSPGSVRTTLRRMAKFGMASRDDEGGWRATLFDPSRVAQEVGTSGKAAAQRRRLREESRQRDEAVRRWRADTTHYQRGPVDE